MGTMFAASEVVEIGIQIEKNGKDFYTSLSQRLKDDGAKEICSFLAGEEERHIAAFEKILKQVEGYEPPEAYPGEYVAYMRSLAREHIFTQKGAGVKAAEGVTDQRQAIDIAMGFERDSITFYEGMKKAVSSKESSVVDSLIEQEQMHLAKLTEYKQSLS